MTNTEKLYRRIRNKDPQAIAYYQDLKRRYEDGKRAELVLNALQALHEQQKMVAASIGALPSAGCTTPSGHYLSQEALSKLVTACYAACRR